MYFTYVLTCRFLLKCVILTECGHVPFLVNRWAIGLFAYQSLDAIDGKQARRTGMAGPLGEMFDHGES